MLRSFLFLPLVAALSLLGGTHVLAGGDMLLSAASIQIAALKDTYSSKGRSGSVGVSTSLSGSVSVSISGSMNSSGAETYTNALIEALGRITIKTPGDMTVVGGVISGGEVVADIGGNLLLKSVQDASWSKSSSFSVGISFVPFPMPSSLSYSEAKTDKRWTNEISEIRSAGVLELSVGGHAELVGSTLWSASDELKFTSASLTVENLVDYDYESGFHFSISGLDKLFNRATGRDAGGYRTPFMGMLSVGKYNHRKEGITYSVIGEGRIEIGGDTDHPIIATLKRDLADRQVVTLESRKGFRYDIPLIDLNALASAARDAQAFMDMVREPSDPEVEAMGPGFGDYYRRYRVAGLSPEEAKAEILKPNTQKLISVRDNWMRAVAFYGGADKVPDEDRAAIAGGAPFRIKDGEPDFSVNGCVTMGPGGCELRFPDMDPKKIVEDAGKNIARLANEIENYNGNAAGYSALVTQLELQMLYYQLCADDPNALRNSGLLPDNPLFDHLLRVAEYGARGGDDLPRNLPADFDYDKHKRLIYIDEYADLIDSKMYVFGLPHAMRDMDDRDYAAHVRSVAEFANAADAALRSNAAGYSIYSGAVDRARYAQIRAETGLPLHDIIFVAEQLRELELTLTGVTDQDAYHIPRYAVLKDVTWIQLAAGSAAYGPGIARKMLSRRAALASLTSTEKLPDGYRELRSVGAAANATGGLPAGYRRVVAPNGDIVVVGPNGQPYRAPGNLNADDDLDAMMRGQNRVANFGGNWSSASLDGTIRNIAGPHAIISHTPGKTIYTNPQTGVQVVYDRGGDYFRVIDTSRGTGRNVYLGPNGNPIPQNRIVIRPDGSTRQTGMSNAEFNATSHFKNTGK